jgi:hypothetical protein
MKSPNINVSGNKTPADSAENEGAPERYKSEPEVVPIFNETSRKTIFKMSSGNQIEIAEEPSPLVV